MPKKHSRKRARLMLELGVILPLSFFVHWCALAYEKIEDLITWNKKRLR